LRKREGDGSREAVLIPVAPNDDLPREEATEAFKGEPKADGFVATGRLFNGANGVRVGKAAGRFRLTLDVDCHGESGGDNKEGRKDEETKGEGKAPTIVRGLYTSGLYKSIGLGKSGIMSSGWG